MNDEILKKIGRRIGPLSELPQELRDQLNAGKTDELEQDILEVLREFEGFANIDELLVGLYKRNGKVQERQFLANKLYRMTKAGHIKSVEGKRGVYQLE